jgi:hypothetical protein
MATKRARRLPIDRMKAEAAEVLAARDECRPILGDDIPDLACHVLALCEEVEAMAKACAKAMQHLDSYGVVEGDPEHKSQTAVFDALRPFVKAVGHGFVSAYAKLER